MPNDIADSVHPTEIRFETCTVSTVRRVAAMLDHDPDSVKIGAPLPRGWQFILMAADTRRSKLRDDGFPGLGVALPDLGLPRLLLGGRFVSFDGDIFIGDEIRRESRVEKVVPKEGRNGPMAIVTILHELFRKDSKGPVLTERQTYVLLGASQGEKTKPTLLSDAPPPSAKLVTPDDTLIFQYSALGFNSHRIHLDRGYARDVEGFPDLVVNGGLSTLLLTEHFRTTAKEEINTLSAKHLLPLFCNQPIFMVSEKDGASWSVKAFDQACQPAVEIIINA
jgi:3-methylfumaryl-CoA hydratase